MQSQRRPSANTTMTQSHRNANFGMSTFVAASIFAICVLTTIHSAAGQTPSPRLHYLYPPSAKMGSAIDVTIGGADLDEASELVFSNPKITASQKMSAATEIVPAKPIPNQFTISIPSEVEPGIYEVRSFGRFGLSTPRRFVVGQEDELVCNEQNKSAEAAMPISVGSAVTGRATANARHFFKFALKDQEKVTIECQTRVIDSKMNPIIVISDLTGKELARSRSSSFRSATIYFKAPRASQYIVEVRDAIFGGGTEYFYRLRVSNLPHIAAVYPNVIQKGVARDVELYGWNLPGGAEASDPSAANQYYETLNKPTDDILLPQSQPTSMPLQPNSYTLDWNSVAIQDKGRIVSNLHPLYISSNPVVTEADQGESTTVSVPVDISGRFLPGIEMDRYEFDCKKGDVYYVDVFSHRLGNDSDVILTSEQMITAGEGAKTWKRVAVIDDIGNRGGTTGPDFSTSSDDPSLRFQAPADGRFRLVLKDQFGTNNSDYRSSYRISIRKPAPDFKLVCSPVSGHLANGNQIIGNALSVEKSGRKSVAISMTRLDGFSGDVEVRCENLSAGVTCSPLTLTPRQSSGELIFSVADTATVGKSLIKIVGKSRLNEQEVTREAAMTVVTWDTGNKTTVPSDFRRTERLELSVVAADVAPVSVDVGTGNVFETSLGGKVGLPIKLSRRNFAEPIKLIATNLPANLKPADLTVAKDKSDGAMELFVKDKNTAVGTYQFLLKGDAKFKHSRNPQAAAREQSEQKRLDELAKRFLADKTATMSTMTAATEKLPMLDQTVVTAKSDVDKLKKSISEEENHVSQLSKAISEAKSAEQKTSNPSSIDPLILSAAEAHLKSLNSEIKNETSVGLPGLLSKVEAAEKAKLDGLAEIESMKKRVAEFDSKQKLIVAEKAASKKRFDALTKQSAAKDVIYKAISNQVTVKIVASPIFHDAIPEQAATPGSKANLVVKVIRKFGFTEAITVTFKAPSGVPGLVIPPITIAKDKAAATAVIDVQANCPAGSHAIELIASGKFNNVDVQTQSSFVVKVSPKPAS